MKNYLNYFFERFDYPIEAREAFFACYDAFEADEDAFSAIKAMIDNYASGGEHNHPEALNVVTAHALRLGVQWQTAHLMVSILLSEPLKKKYEEKGIDEQIWHDSMLDMKWKLFECHRVYHVWGSFVSQWWNQFYSFNIFALGRLQYQMKEFGFEAEIDGVKLTPDMKSVWIHIPSAGPLTKELREDSYSRAEKFFSDYFGDQPKIFVCSSWLLNPKHREMLSPKSNIISFIDDFNIIDSYDVDTTNDLWRIFDDAGCLPPNMLPRDNSMRRAYADWLIAGKKFGRGVGVFIR